MKVIKIPYNKWTPAEVHDIPDAKDLSIEEAGRVLDQMKELIDIEWAEIVLTIIKGKDPHRDYCLIVDEIGKLKDGWTQKINERASQFYAGTEYGDPIVGDVVLCAREWTELYGECDLTGLNEYEEEVLMFHLL